jgi:hypothetical protein
VRPSAGAGFIVAQCGDIMTMPGCRKNRRRSDGAPAQRRDCRPVLARFLLPVALNGRFHEAFGRARFVSAFTIVSRPAPAGPKIPGPKTNASCTRSVKYRGARGSGDSATPVVVHRFLMK